MHKKPREIRIIKSKGEHGSDIRRVMGIQAQYQDLSLRVRAKLSAEIQTQIQLLSLEKGVFGGKVTLYLKANVRQDILGLMDALPPLPLTFYKMRRGRRIWCAATGTEPTIDVLSRTPVAPFTFNVTQGINFAPKVTVQWLSRIDELYTTVEAEIEKDPAYFTLETNRAMLNALKRWRWEMNTGFPVHARVFGSFDHWQTTKGGDDARVICYWPMSRVPENLHRDTLKMAEHCMLGDTSRWEGHHGND